MKNRLPLEVHALRGFFCFMIKVKMKKRGWIFIVEKIR